MQSVKMSIIETFTGFLIDNMINVFLVVMAQIYDNIVFTTSVKYIVIGQILNVLTTFIRRRAFTKWANTNNV